MTPIVNGLQAQYADRIAFVRLDVATTEGQRAQERYGLRGHPAYVLVDAQGRVSWQGVGQLPESELRMRIETLLSAN